MKIDVDTFLAATAARRSIYGIGNEEVVDRERISAIVGTALRHTPSPYNLQSGRVLVLFGEESRRYWNQLKATLKKNMSAEQFQRVSERILGFSSGYGTVLFFDDEAAVKELQVRFPGHAADFPLWTLQSNGMLQHTVWTALEGAGLGASLQHYNPVTEGIVQDLWAVPASWKSIAQMPFGSVVTPPGEKEFLPLESRLRII